MDAGPGAARGTDITGAGSQRLPPVAHFNSFAALPRRSTAER